MNAAWVSLAGLAAFGLAYRRYSAYLARDVFEEDPSFRTPAHERRDDVDFVPAPRHVLFGHHFTSVAGAAPIVGPAIAVIWGWLPAFLWVVLGAVFVGAVHDYGCLMLSARNGGRSIGDLAAPVLTPRARLLFLAVVLFLAWIVLAVFAYVIAVLFVQYPATVLPINIEIALAPVIGWLAYKRKKDLLAPSLIVLALLYAAVWAGTKLPLSLPESLAGLGPVPVWIGLLLLYAFVASVLPVWVMLQPRDLINAHKLFVGLALMYGGLAVARPPMAAPALNLAVPDAPPWMPFLFITIACGAISGFHGLISSGTTSKQLDTLADARPIGYGGMLGEGALALMSVLACTAGFASAEEWRRHYATWASADGMGSKIGAFVEGGSYFLHAGLGLGRDFGRAVVAVMVISFAATTLDSAARIQRYVISELGAAYRLRALEGRYLASALAAFSPLLLVYGGYWKALWPLFGATNQMLAGLSLIVLTAYLAQKRRPYACTLYPMIFVLGVTAVSMVLEVVRFLRRGDMLLTGLSAALLALSAAMILEGWRAARAAGAGVPAPELG